MAFGEGLSVVRQTLFVVMKSPFRGYLSGARGSFFPKREEL